MWVEYMIIPLSYNVAMKTKLKLKEGFSGTGNTYVIDTEGVGKWKEVYYSEGNIFNKTGEIKTTRKDGTTYVYPILYTETSEGFKLMNIWGIPAHYFEPVAETDTVLLKSGGSRKNKSRKRIRKQRSRRQRKNRRVF